MKTSSNGASSVWSRLLRGVVVSSVFIGVAASIVQVDEKIELSVSEQKSQPRTYDAEESHPDLIVHAMRNVVKYASQTSGQQKNRQWKLPPHDAHLCSEYGQEWF
jgi:hypothetical protein